MEDEKQVQNNEPLTKKEKADIAGRDVAEVAARGAGRYYGGAVGGAVVDAALQTKTGQKLVGKVSKQINRNPITRSALARNQQNISQVMSFANSLIDNGMGGTTDGGFGSNASNLETDADFGNSLSNKTMGNENSGKKVNIMKDGLSGAFKKAPLKVKLIIIGIIASFVSLLFVVIIFITPLMELGIIDIEMGSSSLSSSYVNPSYAYCESINVDGSLYDLEDYVAGVVDAEVGTLLSTGVDEALKAYAIQARTYALYNTNGCKKTMTSGNGTQNFNANPSDEAKKIAEDTKGIVLKYNNDLFDSYYDDISVERDSFDLIVNEDNSYTFRYKSLPSRRTKTLTLSDSYYLEQVDKDNINLRKMIELTSLQYASEGKSYEDIIDAIYSDNVEEIVLKKLLIGVEGTEEGLDYIGTYTNVKSGKTYKNYKQYLYNNDVFTFNRSKHLASVGCGTNSAAIVLSGEDSSITPQTLFIENGYNVGTYFGNHYPYKKQAFSYCSSWSNGWCLQTNTNTQISNKDMKNKLVSNLMEGGTAILFVSKNADKCLVNGVDWTQSQHFFVVLDYNEMDNTIYISNPGNNNSSHNGWHSLDNFNCVHVAWLLYSK